MATNNVPGENPSADTEVADFYDDFGLSANWSERVITAVATSLAITIVAAVAVLMGME